MNYLLIQGDASRLPLNDRSVDLVFGSPPYTFARSYGINAQRDCRTWVRWMLGITEEACRVSRGLVLWVVAGQTRNHCYEPCPEGLLWEWWSQGGECHCWRPAYWHRVGIPGSGGKKWLRADVEYVLCFKRPGVDFWTDNTAMGQPPRYGPGGEMSHLVTDWSRRNQWGGHINKRTSQRNADGILQRGYRPSHKVQTKGQSDGGMDIQIHEPPVISNPGNLIKANVGRGKMGSLLAHENEASFPETLVEFFVRSFCPPGGVVLDPFSGSGTTASVAAHWERRAIGLDIRRSQCELAVRRIVDGLRASGSRMEGPKPVKPLPGQLELF